MTKQDRYRQSGSSGVVRVVWTGAPLDMGPPLGRQVETRDGLVVGYFLGSTTWHVASVGLDVVQTLIESPLGPFALREIISELTRFSSPGQSQRGLARLRPG